MKILTLAYFLLIASRAFATEDAPCTHSEKEYLDALLELKKSSAQYYEVHKELPWRVRDLVPEHIRSIPALFYHNAPYYLEKTHEIFIGCSTHGKGKSVSLFACYVSMDKRDLSCDAEKE